MEGRGATDRAGGRIGYQSVKIPFISINGTACSSFCFSIFDQGVLHSPGKSCMARYIAYSRIK